MKSLLLTLILLPSISLADTTFCKIVSRKAAIVALDNNLKPTKLVCNTIYTGMDLCQHNKVVLEIIKTAEITGCI